MEPQLLNMVDCQGVPRESVAHSSQLCLRASLHWFTSESGLYLCKIFSEKILVDCRLQIKDFRFKIKDFESSIKEPNDAS
jgi:hypothetical protein